ncbi:hypothetical protein GGH16_005131, partial [Coemansia sp. RSA 560]
MADGAIFAKKPELALAQHKFAVFNGTPEQRTEALQKLSDGIKQDKMVDFYAQLVSEGVFENDAALAKELEA